MRALRRLLLRLVLVVPVLHRTVSRRFMLLTAVDGTPHTPSAPIRYAVHEGVTIAVPTAGATWWKALPVEGTVPVTVTVKGRQVAMTAELARGDALDEAVLRYLQKYPGEWRALGVDPQSSAEEVEQAAQATPVALFAPVEATGQPRSRVADRR